MIVVIQGTKTFKDYSVFMSGMRSALINLSEEDKQFTVFSAGPVNINNMAMEFINVTERSLKAKGIKPKLVKIPQGWIEQNYKDIDLLAYYALPKEEIPDMISRVSNKGVNVQFYRF
jgi:hypothetical protein